MLLEILGRRYMSIAEQMRQVLRRTALSTNIRERLDFSCAVFDAHGQLVANAPHVPVHLGAMSASVSAIRAAHPQMLPGEVFVTNDPAAGGQPGAPGRNLLNHRELGSKELVMLAFGDRIRIETPGGGGYGSA